MNRDENKIQICLIKEVAEFKDVLFHCGGPADTVVVILPIAQIRETKTMETRFDMVVGVDINVFLQVDDSFSLV